MALHTGVWEFIPVFVNCSKKAPDPHYSYGIHSRVVSVVSVYNNSYFVQNDDTQLTELWFDDDSDDDEDTTVKGSQVESAVPRLYAVFILMWQTLFKVSNSGINIIFIFFAKLLSLLAVSSASLKELAQKIPKNVGQVDWTRKGFVRFPSTSRMHCHST